MNVYGAIQNGCQSGQFPARPYCLFGETVDGVKPAAPLTPELTFSISPEMRVPMNGGGEVVLRAVRRAEFGTGPIQRRSTAAA
jgi:hypothetical protein